MFFTRLVCFLSYSDNYDGRSLTMITAERVLQRECVGFVGCFFFLATKLICRLIHCAISSHTNCSAGLLLFFFIAHFFSPCWQCQTASEQTANHFGMIAIAGQQLAREESKQARTHIVAQRTRSREFLPVFLSVCFEVFFSAAAAAKHSSELCCV